MEIKIKVVLNKHGWKSFAIDLNSLLRKNTRAEFDYLHAHYFQSEDILSFHRCGSKDSGSVKSKGTLFSEYFDGLLVVAGWENPHVLSAMRFQVGDTLIIEQKQYPGGEDFIDQHPHIVQVFASTLPEPVLWNHIRRKSVCIMCDDKSDHCMYCGGKIGKKRVEDDYRESMENV